jgi:hypothetical protein
MTENQNQNHQHNFDLEPSDDEGFELFAEELPAQDQVHTFPPNSLSTLGCECGLSTFACWS